VLGREPALTALTAVQIVELPARFNALGQKLTLDNIDRSLSAWSAP